MLPQVETFEAVPGKGVRARLGNKRLVVGSPSFLHARVLLAENDRVNQRRIMNRKQASAGPLLIGKLSALAGVKPDSVRFYERTGLLPKPARSASGYRVYDEAALRRLRFIKKAQALGFTLDEISRILRLRAQGQPACGYVVRMAEATLSETEQKLRELQSFAEGLRQNLRRWKRTVNPTACTAAEFCNLIESVGEETPKPPQAGVESKARARKARG